MASVQFKDKVTQIPAEWANDVNHLVYDLLQNPKSLADLKDVIGLQVLNNEGGAIKIINGSVDDTPIGLTTPAAGRFTTLTVTQPGVNDEDVATLGSVRTSVENATRNYKNMAEQDSAAVAITGGTLSGVEVRGTGEFNTLTVLNDATSGNEVVRLSQLEEKLKNAGSSGSAGSQNADSVNFTGGKINGVVIGKDVPAEAHFTDTTADTLSGPAGKITLNGQGVGGVGVVIEATSLTNRHMQVKVADNANFHIASGANKTVFAGGRLALGDGTDDNTNNLQVNGAATATKVTVTELTPEADGELTPKKWVEEQVAAVRALIGSGGSGGSPAPQVGSLGQQEANNVAITGGAIDNVVVGATTPANAFFVDVGAASIAGNGSTLALNADKASGHADSGGSLSITTVGKPNFAVNMQQTGVMDFNTSGAHIMRVYGAGQVVVGKGAGNDNTNAFQVYGGAVLKGKLTVGNGEAFQTGSGQPELGTTAPTISENTAKWIPITIMTDEGEVDCVMPVWKL